LQKKESKNFTKTKKSTSNIEDRISLAQEAIDIAFRIYFHDKGTNGKIIF